MNVIDVSVLWLESIALTLLIQPSHFSQASQILYIATIQRVASKSSFIDGSPYYYSVGTAGYSCVHMVTASVAS